MNPELDVLRVLAWLFAQVQFLLFRFWVRRVEGLENLPASGPMILAPNHASWMDGIIVMYGICRRFGYRLVRYLAMEKMFQEPIGWYLVTYECIPLGEGRKILRSYRSALEHLSAGGVIGIFPEGGLTRDGRLLPFQRGAMQLAVRAGVPIVPVTVNGTFESWSAQRSYPRFAPIELVYHPPLMPDPERANEPAYLQELTDRLRRTIAARHHHEIQAETGEGCKPHES